MTYDEILSYLRAGKCDSTADALDRAIEDEAEALHALVPAQGGRSQWKFRKSRIEAAKEFYANDITEQLRDREAPTPTKMLSHRRWPVVWAVAEVLITNALVPIHAVDPANAAKCRCASCGE